MVPEKEENDRNTLDTTLYLLKWKYEYKDITLLWNISSIHFMVYCTTYIIF